MISAALAPAALQAVRTPAETDVVATRVAVDGADEDTTLFIAGEDQNAPLLVRYDIELPIGKPTIIAAFDTDTQELEGLAMSTGDGSDVSINSRSTAATLVALSPGVLSGDPWWLGVAGHTMESPEFEKLVEELERGTDLHQPKVHMALRATVASLSLESKPTDCMGLCAEWIPASQGVLVRNATTTRAAIVGTDDGVDRVCAEVPGASVSPNAAAASFATDTMRGEKATSSDLGSPVAQERLTRLVGVDGCKAPLRAVGASSSTPEAVAAWEASVFYDYALPLIRLLANQGVAGKDLMRTSNGLAGEVSVERYVRALIDDLDISQDQRRLVHAVLPIVGDGALAPASLGAVVSGTVGPPAVDASTTSTTTTIAATTVPPATTTTTTTTTTTAAPATTTTPLVLAATLNAAFRPRPESGPWLLRVDVINEGTAPLDMSGSSWQVTDASSGRSVAVMSIGPALTSGVIAPGATAADSFEIVVPAGTGALDLDWRLGGEASASLRLP